METQKAPDTRPISPHLEANAPEPGREFEAGTQAASELMNHVREEFAGLVSQAKLLWQVEVDSAKLTAQNALVKAGMGLMGFVVLASVAIFSVLFLLLSLSRGLALAFGGNVWLAHLITGVIAMLLVGIVFAVALKKIKTSHFKKTVKKYAETYH